MTFEEVKNATVDTVASFFKGATIVWAEQVQTKPVLPYITLKTNGITRDTFPSTDSDGNTYYNSSTRLEINLYTKGRLVNTQYAGKCVKNYVNTATSDMNDFFKYLDSDQGLAMLEELGISILVMPPIRDLTELQNDAAYRYRAMAEATLSFVDDADGEYGLLNMALPNASEGGEIVMSETVIQPITQCVVQEVTDEE